MGALEGKRALVTGAASGIGRAIALAFAAEGAHVAIVDRAAKKTSDKVAATIEASGGKAFAAPADISDEAQVARLFKSALKKLGGLDILVNNAGIMLEKPLLETSAADFDRVIGVNLRGAFLVGREAFRAMASQRSGRVINIASELAYLGRENFSVYCASKGGVISMTRAWAREFAPDILVNAIAPGPTDTPMLGPESTSPEVLAIESDNPLGRIARPEEIAAAAVFLAGPGASFMTGQCISPNGGAVMF
jgi:3-oxoacyl-[acyl-carrier protein] reductase